MCSRKCLWAGAPPKRTSADELADQGPMPQRRSAPDGKHGVRLRPSSVRRKTPRAPSVRHAATRENMDPRATAKSQMPATDERSAYDDRASPIRRRADIHPPLRSRAPMPWSGTLRLAETAQPTGRPRVRMLPTCSDRCGWRQFQQSSQDHDGGARAAQVPIGAIAGIQRAMEGGPTHNRVCASQICSYP